MKKVFATVLMIIFAFSMLTACQQEEIPKTDTGQGTYNEIDLSIGEVNTIQAKNVEELKSIIQSSGYDGYMYDNFYLPRGAISSPMAVDGMEEADIATAANTKASGADYSETNIQVEGVDEADIIKTDGDYIYTVSNNILYIIKAYPGEDAEIISTIKLDYTPEGLFIDGDKLAVFGYFYDQDFFAKLSYMPRSGVSYFDVYDISDRKSPDKAKEFKFEGYYFRSRMIGDSIYFLTQMTPDYDHPMPMILEDNVERTIALEDIYYYDFSYRYPNYINTFVINMKNYDTETTTVVVENGQDLYMSSDNIFITYTEYINEYDIQKQVVKEMIEDDLTDEEISLINKLKKTDNDILSQYEKESKIWQVYQRHMASLPPAEQDSMNDAVEKELEKRLEEIKYYEYTIINKLSVDGMEVKPEANGRVPGHILNQFSMDEDTQDGTFRIATTVNARWSRYGKEMSESTNNIYTLSKDLEMLDELDGLAEGERIYSTRFMGDRLYLVTFRQVDPFFVIDLSNPKDIKALGELKIPGFSRYLHPYDENTIIGIGQDATDEGRTTGLKISLFDVSDVSDPKEVAKYVGNDRYAQSSAFYEHKAFLFSKEKNLMVIPVYNYDYREPGNNYNGALVFNVSKDDIEMRGLIDHSMASDSWYSLSVERSLYIEELLYTKSNNLLRINKISDLSKVKNIALDATTTKIPVY
ncbi:beta-propeller domain-containing protein [Candidatus Woesearchaeota archaeon]|nr:beta-propeller domain-containing protein [Candidatus Woesearchaeota archaeon]